MKRYFLIVLLALLLPRAAFAGTYAENFYPVSDDIVTTIQLSSDLTLHSQVTHGDLYALVTIYDPAFGFYALYFNDASAIVESVEFGNSTGTQLYSKAFNANAGDTITVRVTSNGFTWSSAGGSGSYSIDLSGKAGYVLGVDGTANYEIYTAPETIELDAGMFMESINTNMVWILPIMAIVIGITGAFGVALFVGGMIVGRLQGR